MPITNKRKRKFGEMMMASSSIPPSPTSSMSSSRPSATATNTNYDVFLSFRGTDTRNGFTSHLFRALKQQGYCVFHDTLLTRGQLVSAGLLQAIAHSKLSILVFSANYADSRWCLDELLKIMECRRSSQQKQIVLPVFHDVAPSHVRNQAGPYAAAFVKHELDHETEHVNKWKAALKEAGNLSGLHLQNDSNGDEADFIRKIVKQVAERVDIPCLHVADYPVGIDSHLQKLNGSLSLGTNDVRAVAIWGIGGIGKTTIAKAVYNEIYKHFQGSCFLADVRETANRPDGSVKLQKKLISGLLNQRAPKIDSFHHGIEVIKQKLRSQKVLIVLDDVDKIDQLVNLAINLSWLAQGSRVIVTTRDKFCVTSLDAKLYEPKPLNAVNSLELFKRSAFGEHLPKEIYRVLSQKVVEYAGGLPLVLKTLGPYMRSLGTVEKWQRALERLKVIPLDGVKEKLMLSFDSLAPREKDLFLDIVGFFIGVKKDFMLQVLAESTPGYYPKFEFKILLNRCLVKVDEDGKLRVHDAVRDMGRAIVREESLDDLRRRRRLWQPEDVFYVLKGSLGEQQTESIILELHDSNEEYLDINAFAKLSKLRLIHIRHLNLVGTYNGVLSFDKLRFLSWYGFPLTSIPSNLDMRSLVALIMQKSKLRQLWKGIKVLKNLRFLDVSDSYFLTSTPDLSGAVNLEEIRLCNCENLAEVHPSIQHLRRLVVLDLSGCCKLFEEVSFSNLQRLFSSMLSWNSPTKSPASSFLLTCFHQGLSSLTELRLGNCNLTHLPVEIGNLASLVLLYLDGNKFSSIPATIKNLQHLQFLSVENCHELKFIDDLPNDLLFVFARGCQSLEAIQAVSSESESESVRSRDRPPSILISQGSKFFNNIISTSTPTQEPLHVFSNVNILAAQSWKRKREIPPWFNYQSLGPFISFVAPQHPNTTNMRGWIICITFITNADDVILNMMFGNVYNKTKDRMYTISLGIVDDDEMLITYVEHSKHGILVEEGDEIEILFVGNSSIPMCGLRIIYDIEMDDQLVIQYSPVININNYYDYDEINDDEVVHAMEYLSPVMIARIKPMLSDLRNYDWGVFVELLKEMAAEGGTHIHNEHRQFYHILANSFYTWYGQTSTGRPSVFLKALVENFEGNEIG